MVKKKVTETVAGTKEYTRDGWVTYMNYFATGEGMTHEIQFCWADSPQEAIEKHLDRFDYKDEKARAYFKVGIVAHNFKSKEAKELFDTFLKDGDKMFHIMQDAAFDFQFKVYWNFS